MPQFAESEHSVRGWLDGTRNSENALRELLWYEGNVHITNYKIMHYTENTQFEQCSIKCVLVYAYKYIRSRSVYYPCSIFQTHGNDGHTILIVLMRRNHILHVAYITSTKPHKYTLPSYTPEIYPGKMSQTGK
jgi:hypothetical protein